MEKMQRTVTCGGLNKDFAIGIKEIMDFEYFYNCNIKRFSSNTKKSGLLKEKDKNLESSNY